MAPTIIPAIEKSFDTSIFFGLNEEENKVNETFKNLEVKLDENDKYGIFVFDIEKEKLYTSYLNNYSQLHIECISPPPEFS
jgi:hypothetical protein